MEAASARWSELMGRPEADVPLDEAALLISAAANPSLDVTAQLRRLDELAQLVVRSDTAAVCRILFEDLGLIGDHDSYDDPQNSYLDRVLDRRLGIPISLSVILVEVARRSGVHLEPVGMPGHFLVRDPSSPGEMIDAFNGGRRLDRAACTRLLQETTGASVPLRPYMLETTRTFAILGRMLANLDRSFARRNDMDSLKWVTDLRLAIPDAPPAVRAELASRLGMMGRLDAAAGVLDGVAETTPDEQRRSELRREALSLRSRLN